MPDTLLSVPDADSRIPAVNDPNFAAAQVIYAEVRRESAARRAAVAATMIREMLPDAATVAFSYDEEDDETAVVTIRAIDGDLLYVEDLADVSSDVPMPAMAAETKKAINLLIGSAHSYDRSYFADTDVDNLDWDSANDLNVYLLVIDDVLADVARYDAELAVKQTAPQHQVCPACGRKPVTLATAHERLRSFVSGLADLLKDGELKEDGEPFEMENDHAYDTLNDLITEARQLLGRPDSRVMSADEATAAGLDPTCRFGVAPRTFA